MISVTVKHGLEEVTKRVKDGTTIGSILGNKAILAAVGAAESSQALVNGERVSSTYELDDGETVVLEKQAASKA